MPAACDVKPSPWFNYMKGSASTRSPWRVYTCRNTVFLDLKECWIGKYVRNIMLSTMYIYCIFLLSTVHLLIASPLSLPLLERANKPLSAAEQFATQQDTSCRTGMDAVYNSSCYSILKIPQWLHFWQMRQPQCTNGNPGIRCCVVDEAWSTCFLRIALGKAGHDCTKINVKSCELEDFELAGDVEEGIDMPEMRYVVRSIYAVNNFFTNWYLATKFAMQQSALIVPSIVSFIDPEVPPDTTKDKILAAFTVGLSLLSLPGIASSIEATVGATAGAILTTALQQAPTVAGAIWPSGDAASQIMQISDLQSSLAELENDVSDILEKGLKHIMSGNDSSVFAAFASSGAFSGPDLPSLPEDTKGLDLAFKTYILTLAMAGNDWQIYTGPPYNNSNVTNVNKLNSSPASQRENFLCNINHQTSVCDTIDSKGVAPLCQPEDWSEYTSQATQRSYYANQKHGNNPTSGAMVNAIADRQWSTLDLVFDGAYKCTANSGSNSKRQPAVSINEQGAFDFSCLSQLEVHDGCEDLNTLGWHYGCNAFFERHQNGLGVKDCEGASFLPPPEGGCVPGEFCPGGVYNKGKLPPQSQ